MQTYAAIDLHSNNHYVVVEDEQERVLYRRRQPNDMGRVLSALRPFQDSLKRVVVESTYNWYWLVDGLQEAGYRVALAHVAAIRPYEGLKHSADEADCRLLNRLSRLEILPQGYIYPKHQRSLRDLLRRRRLLMRQRVSLMLSLSGQLARENGSGLARRDWRKLDGPGLAGLLPDEASLLSGSANLALIEAQQGWIERLSEAALARMRSDESFQLLQTLPGVGEILALTIRLETGQISRFEAVGNYASYCRCVDSRRVSNAKKKGKGNVRNGNPYLCWAFMEASHFAIRFHKACRRFYDRKASRSNPIVARKALAHKLARAAYWVQRNRVAYDPSRLFGKSGAA